MKIVDKILGVILGLFYLGFIVILKMFDILPDKYFVIITICLFIIIALIINRLFRLKKVKLYKTRKIISYIFSLIFIIAFVVGIMYLNKTMNFFSGITGLKEEITNYYIITLKDSKYEEVSDIYENNIGIVEVIPDEVLNSLKLDLSYVKYDNSNELYNALINKKENVILISEIYKNKLEDDYSDFTSRINILHTISISKEIEEITKNVSIKNTPFTVFLSGMDTYENLDTTTSSRSDVNMLVTVNPNTNEILLTSIPRDYYVQLHGTTGYRDKLTHAGYYGINMSITTIEDLLGIDINYYVRVNFNTLVDIVNTIGGISIYSDMDFNKFGCRFVNGYNDVNGACALLFARERYVYAEGDRHRIRNQQEVLTAIYKKITKGSTLVTEYTSLLDAMGGTFQTDIDTNEIIKFIKYKVEDLPKFTIKSIQLDGANSSGYTYTYSNQELWVMEPYQETIDYASKMINGMILGKTINEIIG